MQDLKLYLYNYCRIYFIIGIVILGLLKDYLGLLMLRTKGMAKAWIKHG